MSRKRQVPPRTSSRILAATYSVSVNMLSAWHSVTPPQSPSQGRTGPKKRSGRYASAFSGSLGGRISVSHTAPHAAASRSRRSRVRTACWKISWPLPSPRSVTVTERAVRSRMEMSCISWAVK